LKGAFWAKDLRATTFSFRTTLVTRKKITATTPKIQSGDEKSTEVKFNACVKTEGTIEHLSEMIAFEKEWCPTK
jgi:hypothetical protein